MPTLSPHITTHSCLLSQGISSSLPHFGNHGCLRLHMVQTLEQGGWSNSLDSLVHTVSRLLSSKYPQDQISCMFIHTVTSHPGNHVWLLLSVKLQGPCGVLSHLSYWSDCTITRAALPDSRSFTPWKHPTPGYLHRVHSHSPGPNLLPA